jgi:hypothetical protein
MMRVILLAHSLVACLLATQPVTSLSDLGAFCILGVFFLSIGAASKEERRSYGGLGDWGSLLQDSLGRTQVFLALKKRGDGGVVGIDNFKQLL